MSTKEKKLLIKALCISLALSLFVSVFTGINVFAAKFSGGSGTKKDPYLIKTAQDLNNMRNDLSAHYKLAATIDMSSVKNFEPIGIGFFEEESTLIKDEKLRGKLYKPFKGSFVCDMGADGLPRYAILNLNVYNSIGKDFGYAFGSPNYAGFNEEGNHYLAALFGVTEGATLTNIVLLNASIENTVPGQHGGVGGFDDAERGYTIVKKQVDSTATAGLVGFARGTTVTGCGVQGKIISTTNQTGGLIGAAVEGTAVSNSWADCEISGQGYWSNAGFIGRVNLSNVQSCYAKGTITFKDNHVEAKNSEPKIPSGFIRSVANDSMVSDCYSEVITKGAGNSYTFVEEIGTITNCYATGIKEGKTDISAGEENSKVKNSWIVNQKGANQKNFKAGSMDEIKKAFASLKNWDVSGSAPKLKNAYYITDYSIYVAGKERDGAGAAPSTPGGSDGAQQGTDNTTGTTDGTITDGTNEIGDNADGVTGEAMNQTATEEVTTGYLILFICLAALTVAISASSVITLLKAFKQKKLLFEDAEEEEDYE